MITKGVALACGMQQFPLAARFMRLHKPDRETPRVRDGYTAKAIEKERKSEREAVCSPRAH